MLMIGNDDAGLEEVAAVVAIEVNSRVRWDQYRYQFFEKVSELAGVKLGKKFSAPQSLV